MKSILQVIISLCLSGYSFAGSYTFTNASGEPVAEWRIPWTKQGDTAKINIIITNNDIVPHTFTMALGTVRGAQGGESGVPLFFSLDGSTIYFQSITTNLLPGQTYGFYLLHIPSQYDAGRFLRYLNVFENDSLIASATFPIEAFSAFVVKSASSPESFVVRMTELAVGVTECLPVYFHNTSPNDEVITEFLSVNLPEWITVENIFTFPLVTLPGENIHISDICVTPPEPNMERLEGPVYLIYKNDTSTQTKNIQVYLTSAADTNLLRSCVEFRLDSTLFGPVELGESVTKNVRVKSNRYEPMRLTSASFTWGDTDGFSFNSSLFPLAIEPLGEVTIQLTFKPTTTEPAIKRRYAAGFTVHAESDSSSCDPNVTLTGLSGTLGVDHQTSEIQLAITPNPSWERATIRVTGLHDVMIEICDVLGNIVMHGGGRELEFRSAEPGIFFARVRGVDASGRGRVLARSFVAVR